jgi:AAA15 family ATPase/GTPase
VVIEGFKSYKDQVISEPFSSGINIVGEADALPCWLLPPWLLPLLRGMASAAPRAPAAALGRAGARGIQRRSVGPIAAGSCALRPTRPPAPAVGANGSGKSNFFHGEPRRCAWRA